MYYYNNAKLMALKQVIQIAPKQLRTLVLLMLVLPLVPTGLLVRLLWEEQTYLREEMAGEMQSIYRVYLTAALDEMKDKEPTPAALAERLHKAFGSNVKIRVLGPNLKPIYQDSGFDANHASVSAMFDSEKEKDWLVEVSGAGEDLIAASSDGHMESGMIGLLALLGLVAVTTGLAGYAVSRRLKLEEMQNDSLAMISHELKTPVSSMRVLLETLVDGGVDDKELATDYVRLLLQENHRMSRLVEDFLNHTRLEQREQKFTKEAVEPEEIVELALAQFEPKLRDGMKRVRCYGQGKSAPLIFGDAQALATVLVILLDNALKYSPEDRLDLEIDYFESGSQVYFLVKDRGIGVKRSERRKIFGKFYQADPKLSRLGGGCGLGLSIARHLVHAHGGDIECRRRHGKGCVFCVRLPAISYRVLPKVA
jgi:signal transduction histidine kinase